MLLLYPYSNIKKYWNLIISKRKDISNWIMINLSLGNGVKINLLKRLVQNLWTSSTLQGHSVCIQALQIISFSCISGQIRLTIIYFNYNLTKNVQPDIFIATGKRKELSYPKGIEGWVEEWYYIHQWPASQPASHQPARPPIFSNYLKWKISKDHVGLPC